MDIKDTTKVESESKKVVDENSKTKHKKNKKHPHHRKGMGGPQLSNKAMSKDSIQAIKDSKKIKKESKPVEVIDKDRFNSLKAVFEKKGEKSKADENRPNKLGMDKLSTFTNKENIKVNENSQDQGALGQQGLSEGIKKRMENLLSSNNSAKQASYVDPVLENIKIRGSLENIEDSEEEEFDDDVVYSENESFESEEENLEKEEQQEQMELEPEEVSNKNEENIKEEQQVVVNKVPTLGVDDNEHIFHSNDSGYEHKISSEKLI
jgi:hypothetical protein